MEVIQREAARGCGGVGSESEGEGKMECEGTTRPTNRGDLRLCACTNIIE